MDKAKGLLQRALNKDRLLPQRSVPRPRTSAPCSPVSLQDIYRYRYHHGVNLGSIFVLEKWLYGPMFDKSAEGDSELDAVRASIAVRGLDATIEKWQLHWSNALLDSDLDFLINEAHCNTIRLPIGFFTLGPEYCSGTAFQGDPAHVYESAWSYVLKICKKLEEVGIGVLIDMHALPGGANKDSHSGTSSPTAGLWGDKRNLKLAKKCLLFVAKEIAHGKIPNCTGLQLCNEAAWGTKGMFEFYEDVLFDISQVDRKLPLYISDAWKLDTAMKWARRNNSLTSHTNTVIVDTHKYYTFDEKHKSKTPQELIQLLPEALAVCKEIQGDVHKNGAAPVFIGEYSCVMDTQTWARVPEGDKESLTQQFGRAQTSRWTGQACGSAFWTLKMSWMPGGGWGFIAQTRQGNIEAPSFLSLTWDAVEQKIAQANEEKEQIRAREVDAHSTYWDNSTPARHYEHWRFEAGWNDGWSDALTFFGARKAFASGTAGADRIGCLEGWIRKRMMEVGQTGSLGWEYEHGFRNGVVKAEVLLLGYAKGRRPSTMPLLG